MRSLAARRRLNCRELVLLLTQMGSKGFVAHSCWHAGMKPKSISLSKWSLSKQYWINYVEKILFIEWQQLGVRTIEHTFRGLTQCHSKWQLSSTWCHCPSHATLVAFLISQITTGTRGPCGCITWSFNFGHLSSGVPDPLMDSTNEVDDIGWPYKTYNCRSCPSPPHQFGNVVAQVRLSK